MGRLIHTGLGSSCLVAHVLHSPPPPREQLCNRSCSNKTHTPSDIRNFQPPCLKFHSRFVCTSDEKKESTELQTLQLRVVFSSSNRLPFRKISLPPSSQGEPRREKKRERALLGTMVHNGVSKGGARGTDSATPRAFMHPHPPE